MLVLRTIKELEFDRSMGKLSAKDFDEMSGRLRSRALSLMKQLDMDATGYRATIEQELAARLRGSAASAPRAAARPSTANAALGVCPCGTQMTASGLLQALRDEAAGRRASA